MSWLLWTLVITAALNTLGVIVTRFEHPMTIGARKFDAIYTLCIGIWALVLLVTS